MSKFEMKVFGQLNQENIIVCIQIWLQMNEVFFLQLAKIISILLMIVCLQMTSTRVLFNGIIGFGYNIITKGMWSLFLLYSVYFIILWSNLVMILT